jgi:hypothetical protein
MAAEVSVTGTAEIRLEATGVVWLADVEAQGGDHLRVRLRPDSLGVLPQLATDTAVGCAMDGADGRYYVDATVLEQEGPVLWLRIALAWSRTERRQNLRAPGGFPVSYRMGEVEGIAACMDVSAGGMRLRMAQAPPSRAHMTLSFKLPGEPVPVRTEGLVIYTRPAEAPGTGTDVGVKFQNLSPRDAARIQGYCSR